MEKCSLKYWNCSPIYISTICSPNIDHATYTIFYLFFYPLYLLCWRIFWLNVSTIFYLGRSNPNWSSIYYWIGIFRFCIGHPSEDLIKGRYSHPMLNIGPILASYKGPIFKCNARRDRPYIHQTMLPLYRPINVSPI